MKLQDFHPSLQSNWTHCTNHSLEDLEIISAKDLIRTTILDLTKIGRVSNIFYMSIHSWRIIYSFLKLYWTKEPLWRLWPSYSPALLAWNFLVKITLRIELSSQTHSETTTSGFATNSFPNQSSGTCGVQSLSKKNHRHAFSISSVPAVLNKMAKQSTKGSWLTYVRLRLRTCSKYFQPMHGKMKPTKCSRRKKMMPTY